MGYGGHLRLPAHATRAAAGVVVRWAIVLFADRFAVQRAGLRYDTFHNVLNFVGSFGRREGALVDPLPAERHRG